MPAHARGVEVDDDGDSVADIAEGSGRAGVDGRGAAVADVAVNVPVAEGDVFPLGALGEVVRRDAQGALQLGVLGDGVAVGNGDVPGALLTPGRGLCEGPLQHIDGDGASPHGQVEVGKVEEFAVGVADEAEAGREPFEVVALVGAVAPDGVVVAGQEDGPAGEAVDLVGGEGDDLRPDAGVIEEVAGDEEEVGLRSAGEVDDGLEAGFEAATTGLLASAWTGRVGAQVDVGGVYKPEGTGFRRQRLRSPR